MVRLMVGVAALVTAAGCSVQGETIGRENAQSHFQTHRVAYERLVELVTSCELTGTLWAETPSREDVSCSHIEHSIAPLVTALQDAEAISVTRIPAHVDMPSGGVAITVATQGLGVSGSLERFVYSSQPLTEPPLDEGDGASGVERLAVTSPPYQWWWEPSY